MSFYFSLNCEILIKKQRRREGGSCFIPLKNDLSGKCDIWLFLHQLISKLEADNVCS